MKEENKAEILLQQEKEIQKVIASFESGKRVNDTSDRATGMSILTRLPGKELTLEERKQHQESVKRQQEQWAENQRRYLEEHPPLDQQLDQLLNELAILKEHYPYETNFTKMEQIIQQTREDHVHEEW